MLDNNFFDYDFVRQRYKVIVDASHGGDDTGIVVDGVSEKNLALDISRYMYDELRKLGVDVSITRDSDITLSDQRRIDNILNTYGNSSDVIIISNHIDSDEDNAQIIYALRNDNRLTNLIEEQLRSTNLIVKEPYQRRLPSDTSLDYYSIHRDTGNTQPILIQYGNMSDYSDIKINYKKYVDAVVNALSSYLGLVNFDNNYYIVQSGDTLYSIARKFDLTVDDIKKINNLSSNFLTIGQRLLIDNEIQNNNSSQYENIYYVKSGDTLYGIAKNNDVSVDELKAINNLSSNILSIGQILKLPIKSDVAEYVLYTVKSGDSLYGISRNYNISVDDLKKYNNLNSDSLSIGQILRIPFNSILDDDVTNSYINYIVKKGDNLYSIARNYNISVSDIMNYNNLTTNLLSIGQILRIPTLNNNSSFYVVKSGDNLYSIARRYNTTVDNIKAKNNLTSNLLSIGQKLII